MNMAIINSDNQFINENSLLTSADVMRILKIGRTKFWKITKNGELKGIKMGNNWRFPKENLEHYIKGEPQE